MTKGEQMLGIIDDKDGTIYKFEDHPKYDIELHGIRDGRIICSYIASNGILHIFTVDKSGSPQMWTGEVLGLIPYDKFRDLKKAYSEGAIIECLHKTKDDEWNRLYRPVWDDSNRYRIKGDISISSWQAHQDLIKQWWDGAEIEIKNSDGWIDSSCEWYTDLSYRVKLQAKEMTLSEIAEELGYDVKVIK